MKKGILLITLILTLVSCKTKKQVVFGNTLLKNIPTEVFTPNKSTVIRFKEKDITYNNTFKRLPNSEFSKFYLKKHPKTYMPYFNISVNLSANGKITLEGTQNDEKHLVKEIKEFADFASEGKPTLIHLNFDENITFKAFYTFLQLIKPIQSQNIKISNTLFIYDTKQLPDCDCNL